MSKFNSLPGWTCKRALYDPCLFIFTHTVGKKTTKMFSVIHTDDVDTVAEDKDDMDTFFAELDKRFKVKPGDKDFMLGLKRDVSEDGKTVTVTMPGFVDDLHNRFKEHISSHVPDAPFPPGLFLSKQPAEEADPANGAKFIKLGYQSVVGGLLWATRNCYPECAVGVQYLCRQMSCPSEEAWRAAMHMVAYLKANRENGIRFVRAEKPSLSVYYDASNKGTIGQGTAIGGHVAMLLGGPIEWCCRKLPVDTSGQSSHHNEYMALSAASKTVQWLTYLITEMGFPEWVEGPTKVYGDNDAATKLSTEDYITTANRYYRKDAHFCKTSFELGITSPLRVDTTNNLADGLTKSLPSDANNKLAPMLKGYVPIAPECMPDIAHPGIRVQTTDDGLDMHIGDPSVREQLRKDALRRPVYTESGATAPATPSSREGELMGVPPGVKPGTGVATAKLKPAAETAVTAPRPDERNAPLERCNRGTAVTRNGVLSNC
jgi:hypothetical protein